MVRAARCTGHTDVRLGLRPEIIYVHMPCIRSRCLRTLTFLRRHETHADDAVSRRAFEDSAVAALL